MKKNKVFIDGSAGTTGLRIRERLGAREDLLLITLPEELRKDPAARAAAINSADVAFLCLPDDAAREAVKMAENPDTVIIDASTAHRTAPGWAYGFPELGPDFEEKIRASGRIAVPGCHAGGFIALVYPLIRSGLLSADAQLSCFSLTGYSGGGKKMIAEYEAEPLPSYYEAPRVYGLTQGHKHLKEMTAVTGLRQPPVFLPTVGNFYSGMEVSVQLFASMLRGGASADDVRVVYAETYRGLVRYAEAPDENGFLSAGRYSGTDGMEISVSGNAERFVLTARYDNLGKGASGAAVECMNLALGVEKTTGLTLLEE